MKKKKRSSKKRLLAWLLVIAVTLGSIPNTVTYYATDDSQSNSDDGGAGSSVVDNSANNEEVQIQLVDSYDGQVIENISDVIIHYNIVTEVVADDVPAESVKFEATDDWKTVTIDSTVTDGKVTVLKEKTIAVSTTTGEVTKLYLQVEKENYVTYKTVVELKENSEDVEALKEVISLDKEILKGISGLTYSEDTDGKAVLKALAELNDTIWKDFLDGKTLQYAAKEYLENATVGDTTSFTDDDWKDKVEDIQFSSSGAYEVFVKITEGTDTASYTTRTGSQEWIQSIIVEIEKADIEGVSITENTDLKYNEQAQELVIVEGLKAGDTVTWTVDSSGTENDVTNTVTLENNTDGITLDCKIPTGTLPGDYTVGLTVNRGENYEELKLTPVTTTIVLGEIEVEGNLKIIPAADSFTYNGNAQQVISNVKNTGDYKLAYILHKCKTDSCQCEEPEANDEDWGESDASELIKLTITDAGSYKVWVRVSKENYGPEIVSVPITIAKKEISSDSITISKNSDVNWNYDEKAAAWSLVKLDAMIDTSGELDATEFFYDENSTVTWSVEKAKDDGTWETVVQKVISENDGRTEPPTAKYTPGTYRVTLTIENKNYETYTTILGTDLVVNKGTFSVSETLTAYSGTYDGKEHPVLSLDETLEETRDYSFKYHLCDCSSEHNKSTILTDTTITWSDTIPTVKNADFYKVWVKAVKEHYNDVVVDVYDVEVKKAGLTAIEVNNPTLVYDATTQNIVALSRNLIINPITLSDTVNFKEKATWTVKFKSLVEGSDWETKLDKVVSNDIPKYDIPGTYEVTLTVNGATQEGVEGNWNTSNYEPFTKTVIVTIDQGKLDVTGLTVTGYSGSYDGTEHEAVIKTPESGYDYKLYYHLCEMCKETHTEETILKDNFLTWVENIPKVKNAGSYTIWVKAVQEHYYDENVTVTPGEDAVGVYNIYIKEAESELKWSNTLKSEDVISKITPFTDVTYDFSAEVVVEEGKTQLTTGAISYTVLEKTGTDKTATTNKATIDENTGVLTVTEPGTYVVTATLAEDDNCSGDTISHTLVVSAKPSQTGEFIGFYDGTTNSNLESVNYTFKAVKEVISTAQAVAMSKDVNGNIIDDGDITYTIDKTDIGIACNEKNGEITVTNYKDLAGALIDANGSITVTVTATKAPKVDSAGNVVFDEDSTSYDLVISFANLPTNFKLDDWVNEPNGTDGWYKKNDDITIPNGVIVTVPDAYKDTYTVSTTYDGTFSSSVTFNDEGQNERIIYLKNTNGEITAPIKLVDKDNNPLKIDTIAPDTQNMSISYSEPNWIQKLIETVSFGFYNPSVEITFTVADETGDDESGLAFIEWFYTKEADANSVLESNVINVTKDEANNVYTAKLTLTAEQAKQYRGNISFKAIDNAGNKSNLKKDTGNVIILDTINPTVQGKYGLTNAEGNIYEKVGNKYYYSDEVTFTFMITEANFFEEDILISVSKDGATAENLANSDITWTSQGNDVYHGTFSLKDEGEYVVYMKYLNTNNSLADENGNPLTDAEGNSLTDENGKPLVNESGTPIATYTSETIIIDKTAPIIGFAHDGEAQTITVTVTEDNFRPQDISLDTKSTIKDINGKDVSFTVTQLQNKLRDAKWEQGTDENGNPVSVYTCSLNYKEDRDWSDGIYNLTIQYTDIVERSAEPCVADEFIIDHTSPVIEVSYNTPTKKVGEVSYYNGVNTELNINNPLEVTLTVIEPNFVSDNVKISVTKDGSSVELKKEDVTWSYGTDENDSNVIDKSKNIGTFTLSEDGHYNITVECTDSFDNAMTDYIHKGKLVIDSTIPTIDVKYTQKNDANADEENKLESATSNNTNYFAKQQTATITVTERNFDENNVKVNIIATKHDGTVLENTNNQFYTISEWTKGTVVNTHIATITYFGDANYSFYISATDIIGNEAVNYETQYFTVDTSAPDASTDKLVITYSEGTSLVEKLVKQLFGFYNDTVTVTFTAEDDISGIHSFKWKTANEMDSEWKTVSATAVSKEPNKYTAKIELQNEMRDSLQVIAVNKSGCESNVQDGDRIIVVDKVSPELKVEHTLFDTTDTVYYEDVDNHVHYYSDDVKFTFTITEANFFEEDINISVLKDGQPINQAIQWTTDKNDTTIHYGTFILTDEGDYVVSMKYLNGEVSQDNSSNHMLDATIKEELPEYKSEVITIDKTNPVVEFEYDKETQTTLFTVKEHNFCKEHISVTGSIVDVNKTATEFTVADLEDVLQTAKWIQGEDEAGNTTDVWTYTFDYKENGVSLDGVYDLTINYKDFVNRTDTEELTNFTIDRTKPEIKVDYNDPTREVNGVSYYSINENVEKKNPLEVTITIDEENFEEKDVIITVTKDETEVSNLMVTWTTDSTDASVHIGTFTLSEDGHYDIGVTYTDSFKNVMNSYTLVDALVIDSTPSMIDVTYTKGDIVNTLTDSKNNNRKYFAEKQTVTITVTERNFKADEVQLELTAHTHDLNKTALENTENQLYKVSEWTHNGNTHTLTIDCYGDANYGLDINYKDLATNASAKQDYFTVDTTSPVVENLVVTYPDTNFIDKIINGVKEVFGFHGSEDTDVTVIFTADDATAGIKSFKWKTDMDSEEEWQVVDAVVDSEDPNKYTAEITLPNADEVEQLRAHVQVIAIDKSGNESAIKDEIGRNIVVDTISPTLKANHMLSEETGNYNLVNGVHYYSEDVAFTFIIEETNFFPEDVSIFVAKDGGNAELLESEDVTWVDYYGNKDIHYGTFILSGDGDYVVSMKYLDEEQNKDNSGNVMIDAETGKQVVTYQSDVITIDKIDPEVAFTYDKETQSTTFTVTEHNFRPGDIRIDATKDGETPKSIITDVNGNATKYTVEDLETVLQNATWTQSKENADVWTYTFDYKENEVSLDGIYDLKLDYTDLAKRDATPCEPDNFIIDRTPATNVSIAYETSLFEMIFEMILEIITLGFYNPTVEVTFTAYDCYSGVDTFSWNYTQREGTSSVNRPTDTTETVVTAVQDKTDKSKYTATIVLSDNELRQMHGYLSVFTTDKYQNKSAKITDDGRVFVVDTISPTMKVEYSPQNTQSDDETIFYYQGNAEVTFYVNEANFYKENVNVTLSKDGAEAVPITVEWTDVNVDEHIGKYTISGDGDYVLYVTYSDYSQNVQNVMVDEVTKEEIVTYQSHIITIDTVDPIVDFTFNEAEQTTTFIVTEHNFHSEGIVVNGTRKDLNDNDLHFEEVGLTELLQNAEWEQNGDVYTYTFDYKKDNASLDGIYNVTLDYTDLSNRVAETHQPEAFTIDRAASSNVAFSYSQSIVDTILEAVTLGFYNPSVTVTLTSYDKYIGVDYFEWHYTRQADVSGTNRATDTHVTQIKAVQDKQDKSKFTATFELPNTDAKQLRGYLAATATDKYDNTSQNVNDAGRVVVVDAISPTITAQYSDADRVVGKTAYYNNDVEVTFTVNEANFFAEDVKVSVSKDGGKSYTLKTKWTDITTDVHVGTCTLSGDGDYVITVNYTDRSLNQMKTYTSHVVTIDTILPVIDVAYRNTNVVNTLTDSEGQEREYFADTQTAVVTVTEHNFNAEEVEFSIVAKDVTGAELDANRLHMKAEWEEGVNEDTHVAVITYPGDANYTFDVAYTDLATNVAKDYELDYFTVDNTAPVNLKTEYSTSLLDTILEVITFGFYNAKVNVTLTAEDETSGVHEFKYSYLNAVGVSGVNAELIDQAISASEIVYSNSGKTATVEFSIPKDVLTDVTQFNGTVSFEATDRAGLKNTLEDNRRIVVDNIAPTAQITYNEPVNMEGTISYYDGDVQATVVINEANFYSEDVVVTVSKDGGTSYAVTPSWTNNSADVHTGTFTLSEDGDYFITITYRDKSSNEMAVYTSEQLTIDTNIEAPIILFNGNSENGQAYKGEIIPTISFTDVNYDSFEVHLYRTYKGARDVEITEEKELNGLFNISEQSGDATFNIFDIGEDGRYNPNDDGIYHLVITMNDKSGHTVDSEAYFTVNRYGSVYEYSEYLSSLIADGGAYVKEVTEDLVITEYNADRLVSQSLDIEITRDGKPLDIVDYSVSPAINEHVAVGESGWFQYEYTISKGNFTEDGIYKISVSSKDATGNAPENNNFEDKNIRFYVDSTVPEITSITGLEEGVVNGTQLNIRYMVFDVIGLKSVKIYVDGEVLEEITDFEEEFNHYEGEFTLEESENKRTIRLVVEDLAGNITDTDSKEFKSAFTFNKEVIVTTNSVARFLANEELVNAVIGGTVAVVAVAGGGIFLKRRKKVKAE